MKDKTRITALSLVFSSLLSLCSCSETTTSETNIKESTTPNNVESETEAELSEFEQLLAQVPVENLEGFSFDFLNFHDCGWANTIMSAEELTGETLNDAIWQRNDVVSNKLNVTINEIVLSNSQIYNALLTSIKAADDAYDAAWGFTQSCSGLLKKDYLWDIKDLEYMNLDAPWYNQTLNEQLNFGDAYYMLLGDAHMGFYQAMYVWGFNKTLLEDNGLEDPYTLYEEGTWTWDKMYNMASAVSLDLDGNGKYDITEDQYGLGIHNNMGVSFLHSSGYTLTERDAENLPMYSGVTEQFYNAYEKACTYLYCSPNMVAVSGANCESNDVWDAAFQEDRCLFVMDAIGAFADHRESEVLYGILSVPKYTEEQQDYITPMFYNTMSLYIPLTNNQVDYTGIVLENMYAESYKTVRTSFIESVVYYKFARDEKSIANLDECIDNASVDVTYVFNWGQAQTALISRFLAKTTDLVSTIKKLETKLQKEINQTIEAYTKG